MPGLVFAPSATSHSQVVVSVNVMIKTEFFLVVVMQTCSVAKKPFLIFSAAAMVPFHVPLASEPLYLHTLSFCRVSCEHKLFLFGPFYISSISLGPCFPILPFPVLAFAWVLQPTARPTHHNITISSPTISPFCVWKNTPRNRCVVCRYQLEPSSHLCCFPKRFSMIDYICPIATTIIFVLRGATADTQLGSCVRQFESSIYGESQKYYRRSTIYQLA